MPGGPPRVFAPPTTAAFANQSLGLRTTASAFDYFPSSRCVNSTGPPLLVDKNIRDHAACEALCIATPKCMAAQFDHPFAPTQPCTNETNPSPDPDEERDYENCVTKCASHKKPDNSTLPKCKARCHAARLSVRLQPCLLQPQCVLYDFCLERISAPQPTRSDVMHRWGPTWPRGKRPHDVEWKANATIVIVSYRASLAWLRSLPGKMFDVVVYHKSDFGHPNITYPPMSAEYVLGHLREQELCGFHLGPQGSASSTMPPVRGRRAAETEPWHSATGSEALVASPSLHYAGMEIANQARMANLSVEEFMRRRRISASTSHGHEVGNQTLVMEEFNRKRRHQKLHYPHPGNVCPNQCTCGRRSLEDRPWLQYFAVLPNYGQAVRPPFGGSREPFGFFQFVLDFWDNLPPVTIFTQDDCLARGCGWGQQLPLLGQRLQMWQRDWGAKKPISRFNCLCKFVSESNYKPRGYYWYRWMSFAQEQLFGVNVSGRHQTVTWPQDATFAVGRSRIREQPLWMYEAWTRLTTTERACFNAATIQWAHSLERLWFELFDASEPKELKPWTQKDMRSACFLGARRRR